MSAAPVTGSTVSAASSPSASSSVTPPVEDRSGSMSLRRRLGLALVVAGVVMAAAVAGLSVALAQMEQRQRDVFEIYYTAVTQGTTGYLSLVDAETAVRGYALTGNTAALEPYTNLLSGETVQPDDVQGVDVRALFVERFGPDYPPLESLDRASAAALRWYEEFAQPTIDQVGAGEEVTVADIEAGVVLFDELRGPVEEYLDAIRADRRSAVDELDLWREVLVATLVLLGVSAIAVGVLLWVFLRRWITTPLTVLAEDARRVAEGDLDHVVGAGGPAEVGEVARDVEAMRARLAALVARAKASQAEVEASHQLLQEQAEDLRRSNRDLEQFAYVASHDLQEPLRKIASFTQLLAKRYEGQLDERADQYIGFAVDGAKRMQRLINDLLSFSRVGRIGGEISDVDLEAALGQVLDDLGPAIEESGATVETSGLPVIRGEGPLLVQLLQNLVANAVKFRDPERAPVIRLAAEQVGDHWEFSCSDNGIGIDAQYADRVFVIFQRLHAKDVYEGTGIGLALCKKIVEYHGGHIWIDTSVTEGTTIRWRLPADPALAPQTPEADAASTPEPVAVGGRKDT